MPSAKYLLKRTEQLGMNYSTAVAQLRKLILFKLAKQCQLDICVRCKEPILSVDDFTIDHIEAWLDTNTELFWNLENVGFSHTYCNSATKRTPYPTKAIEWMKEHNKPPLGEAWCSFGKHFTPTNNFTKNRGRWNKLADSCRSCRKRFRAVKPTS